MKTHTPTRETRHASRSHQPFFASIRSRSQSPPFFQPKLRIGAPGDRFEQEADRVADRVVRGDSAPAVQRMCMGCNEEHDKLQRQPAVVTSAPTGMLQREEGEGEGEKEDKDPLKEGAKLTAGKVLAKPEVKKAAKDVWESLPPDAQAGLMTVGGVSLGMGYLIMILSSEAREEFSGADIGKPLSLIPYLPIESFKYVLPASGKSELGLSAGFSFDDYFKLINKHFSRFPVTGLSFGLEGTYSSGSGLSITGGKGKLELFGGILKAEAKTFTELSPYPMWIPGAGFGPPSRLMQSYPALPGMETGFGAQGMLSIDFAKLFPRILGGGSPSSSGRSQRK